MKFPTDVTINALVQEEIYDTYKRYSQSLATDCNVNPHVERIPIVFNEPVYGSKELTYRDFMAPGVIVVWGKTPEKEKWLINHLHKLIFE